MARLTVETATAVVKAIGPALRAALTAVVAPLAARVAALEERPAEPGPPGPPGHDGAVGQTGPAGRDGVDGLGFADLTAKYDGARRLTLVVRNGERVKEFPFDLPIPLFVGVYDAAASYSKGDVVSHAGSAWVAVRDTSNEKPDEHADDRAWRLCVKRGRDGRVG
jgi:integrin beta 3